MNRELSMANAIAHGGKVGAVLFFRCENCRGKLFEIQHFEERKENRHADIIIKRTFYLKCVDCGAEEGSTVLTIIPSWVNNPMREEG